LPVQKDSIRYFLPRWRSGREQQGQLPNNENTIARHAA
jgi:hypothetical protein